MKQDWQNLINDCEAGIREGRAAQVKQQLLQINSAQVDDPFRLSLARLCRRVALNDLGLRILSPLVVEGRRSHRPTASPAEMAEYAVLLQRLGIIDESLKILGNIDSGPHPESLLYRAFCHFNRWEYFESVPLLKAYLASGLPAYQELIGQVNLAAALVATRQFDEARPLLNQIISVAQASGYKRLEANCYEIRAQVAVEELQMAEAQKDLTNALQILKGESSVGELSTMKWQAIIEANKIQSVDPLLVFRKRAHEFGDWEAVRDCDLNRLSIQFDSNLFRFHLFGSPWVGYRERAQRTLGKVIDEEFFEYGPTGGGLLDISQSRLNDEIAFPTGSKIHRAISALVQDFYRPVRLGTLFARLFPDEYFDVFTSPNRVHQVIFRLRAWIEQGSLPLVIEQSADGYRLKITKPFQIRVPYEKKDPDANQELLRKLYSIGSIEAMSLHDCAGLLSLSPATCRRFLKWAMENGNVEKVGAGPTTGYRLKVSQKKAA